VLKLLLVQVEILNNRHAEVKCRIPTGGMIQKVGAGPAKVELDVRTCSGAWQRPQQVEASNAPGMLHRQVPQTSELNHRFTAN
jgi:hypothetical protein